MSHYGDYKFKTKPLVTFFSRLYYRLILLVRSARELKLVNQEKNVTKDFMTRDQYTTIVEP